MKKLFIAVSMFVAVLFSANSAKAQNTGNPELDLILGNLIAVVIEDVKVDIQTGDITLVNVENVLNNTDIQILKDFVITITIDDTLNNLLRKAELISRNQIVVGILSDGTFLILDQKRNKK